jgi:hypothetical protein
MKYLLILLWLYPDGTVERKQDEIFDHPSACTSRALHHELTDRPPTGVAQWAICTPVREA